MNTDPPAMISEGTGFTLTPKKHEQKYFLSLRFKDQQITGWCSWELGIGGEDVGLTHGWREVTGTLSGNNLTLNLKHAPSLDWIRDWRSKWGGLVHDGRNMQKFLNLADDARKLSSAASEDNHPYDLVIAGTLDTSGDRMEGTARNSETIQPGLIYGEKKVVLKKLSPEEASRATWCCSPNPPQQRGWGNEQFGPNDSLVPRMIAVSLNNAGCCAMANRDFKKAKELYEQSRSALGQNSDPNINAISKIIGDNQLLLSRVSNENTAGLHQGWWINSVTGGGVNYEDAQPTAPVANEKRAWSATQGPMHLVYTTSDIPEGAVISAANLEEREAPLGQMPIGVLTSTAQIVGHQARYTLARGSIVTNGSIK